MLNDSVNNNIQTFHIKQKEEELNVFINIYVIVFIKYIKRKSK